MTTPAPAAGASPRGSLPVIVLISALWAVTASSSPLAPTAVAAGPAADCAAADAVLTKERSELPSIDIASPTDRPPYCITLETLIAFAGRLKAHVARCPGSVHAGSLAESERMRADHSRRFSRYRCRRSL